MRLFLSFAEVGGATCAAGADATCTPVQTTPVKRKVQDPPPLESAEHSRSSADNDDDDDDDEHMSPEEGGDADSRQGVLE